MPKALDVAHVIYDAANLDLMEAFMKDFGLVTAQRRDDALFMRAADPTPFVHVTRRSTSNRFAGAALRMASRDALETLASIQGSSSVEPVDDMPGGGWRVRMKTPDNVQID